MILGCTRHMLSSRLNTKGQVGTHIPDCGCNVISCSYRYDFPTMMAWNLEL